MKKFTLSIALIAILGTYNLTMAQISVSPVARLVTASSGTTSFTVSSTVGWSVSDNASWLTATKTNGTTISVSYVANTSTSSRTANITATGTGYSKTVTVKQEGAAAYLAVSPDNTVVGYSSGTTTLYVSSNVGWSVSDDVDWLTATKTSGTTISVSYTLNLSEAWRTANIIVNGTGGISETVTVVQDRPFISFEPYDGTQFNAASGTTLINVYTNLVEWTVTDNASWLTIDKTPGSTLLNVSFEENPFTNSRSANITVNGTGDGNTISQWISITQAGIVPYLDVSPNDKFVSGAAGSTTFNVSSNVGWSVTDDADWCTAVKTDGNTITVNYESNESLNWQRAVDITVTGTGGVTETVTLEQDVTVIFEVTPDNKSVSASSGTLSLSVDCNVGWGAINNATWFFADTDISTSTINVSYDANPSASDRTGTFKVSTGHPSIPDKIITISQAGMTIDVSPNSRSVSKASGTTSFSVSLTGPEAFGWGVADDASWLTATHSGDNISVTYEANTSATPRTANITANGNGGISETVTVIQEGITFLVSPDNRNVGAASGSTTFSVSSDVGWSVSDNASWLTATKTNGTSISVSYIANTSTISRTASITASGTGGAAKTVTVTQDGAAIIFDVSPNIKSINATSGTTSFSVNSNVGWSVSDDADWLTATKANGTTINVLYAANTSTSQRTANITATGTGGVSETVTLSQAGAAASLDVSPNSESVGAASGAISFSVNSNVEWSVSDDVGWLTAAKTDESTINVSYDANTTASSRTAQITTEGTGGVTETVTLIQLSNGITFDLSPNNENVSAASGNTSFSVSSNVEWSVSDDVGWLTATKTDENTIGVSYEDNTSTDPRMASITANGTGGATKTVTVTQDGAAAYLEISPSSESVGATSGTLSLSVNSNVAWVISENEDWITAAKTDESTIKISYDANTSTSPRTGYLGAFGAGAVIAMVELNQEGAAIMLNVSPDSESVGAEAGTTSYSMNSNVEWSVSDDADWLTAAKSDENTISVSFEANTTGDSRTAHITVEGTGGASETVTLIQLPEGITFEVSPANESVSAASGTLSFNVTANVEWNVSDDAGWLTATKTDESTISVSFDANTSLTARFANITAEGTGGAIKTVVVTQDGATAYLDLGSDSLNVGPEADSTIFTVLSNIDWSVSVESEWLTVTRTADTLLTIYYDENTALDERVANVTLSGEGVPLITIAVKQGGAIPSGIFDLFINTQITIYPNPTSSRIYLKSGSDIGSEIMFTLYDDSGRLLYSRIKDGILSGEPIEIDISAYKPGTYLLRINNSGSYQIKKVIKQ